MNTKKTIKAEAQEMLEEQLHEKKVRETGRLLVALHVLTQNYESKKESLEKQLKEVDAMTIASMEASECSNIIANSFLYTGGNTTCSN